MKVSLLIPCYNAGRYLPRLAESVRAQTTPFAEIICYDDGSTDDTVAIARSLGWRILTPNPNRGPAYARNRLREATTTEWIHYHDADDLMEPTFVKRMTTAIAENPDNADVIVCNMDWLNETTRALAIAWRYDASALSLEALAATITHPISMIACVYRRTKLDQIGGLDDRLRTWEDGDLHVRLAAAGARFTVVPEVLSISLRHNSGASADGNRVIADRLDLLERYAVDYPDCSAVPKEAEKLAVWLIENRLPGYQRMLELCRRAGHRVPTTRHPIWRVARTILPSIIIIYLRYLLRRLQSALSFS
jgi:glycosyltransferase involved in cell wall biosynthesis